jgi:hypothetical protein
MCLIDSTRPKIVPTSKDVCREVKCLRRVEEGEKEELSSAGKSRHLFPSLPPRLALLPATATNNSSQKMLDERVLRLK